MPFLQAGFNFRNRSTGIVGWTRHVRGRHFALSRLIRFMPANDYAWYGQRHLAWGDFIVLGTHWGFELPWEYQNGLGSCDIATRKETPAWEWAEERRRDMTRGTA